jgi:hypothetical protein
MEHIKLPFHILNPTASRVIHFVSVFPVAQQKHSYICFLYCRKVPKFLFRQAVGPAG